MDTPIADRVFLIVLDSLGIGELPDAADYGDKGSDTFGSIAASSFFCADNLTAMGFGNIDYVSAVPGTKTPTAAVARMAERSRGKDTTVGHWEIAGLISDHPLPTYPNGFPADIIARFEAETGKKTLCNLPYSGTEVIRDYGRQAIAEDALIVYTSADSVFQIAAHEDHVPPEKLYEYCRIARNILQGEHGVGRVIARPFIGEYPNFIRTSNRHDFSIEPPAATLLDQLKAAGLDSIAVGKITDIFAGRGITRTIFTHSNTEGMEVTAQLAEEDFHGLCFVNLVEFDSKYGHRNDIDGYAKALAEFDVWLGGFLPKLRENDVLMITADHGCDPGTPSTDHSREYTPLLIFGKHIPPIDHHTRSSFADIAATVSALLGIDYTGAGEAIDLLQ